MPTTTLGAGALVELERDPWILALAATTYRRQFVGGPRDRIGGAYVDLSTFEVDACWQRAIATHGLRACLGVELGSEGTRGVGIERSDTTSAFWGAANVGLQARPWQDRGIAPMAGVVVGHAFAAPDVVIQGFGTLFEAPFLFVRLQLGLEIRLF
ncbi:hypothetical protein AKJ09_00327 [Labilithrix luteola]|uniref:Uncharacterized protein n=1 Tax=Labilithrix luteola TaxID=1391654 RepID=A0A0K1PJE0_9BACT|nr:hypothetical protein AKJ09_00327 [Labilithrix luteola]